MYRHWVRRDWVKVLFSDEMRFVYQEVTDVITFIEVLTHLYPVDSSVSAKLDETIHH